VYLLDPQPQPLAEPFPGMLGSTISIKNGSFVDDQGGWGGGDDSFYEYLIKVRLIYKGTIT
jgi:mannosyl-oligosaccharide alpha-1,2-mannosidase